MNQPLSNPGPADVAAQIAVWDPFVRLFHWLLVAAVLAAGTSGFVLGSRWIDLHVWAGAVMAALVAARLIWGLAGGRYARFSGFVAGPHRVLAHVKELWSPDRHRHLGHNPLGGLMIVALLATTGALAVTGLVVYGGVLKSGPLAFATSFAAGWSWRKAHEFLAWCLVFLVALHIAGAIHESRRMRENLVRAMVSGRKAARAGDIAPPERRARPLAAVLAAIVLSGGGAGVLAELARRPAVNVPQGPLDPVYASECGACHMAYHPSLLPRKSWEQLLGGLADHFGEDASLDAETTARLRTYVMAHAAEAYDTLPAHRLAEPDPAAPYTLTATRFWKRMHGDIPDAVFTSHAVGSRSNCAACHGDAASGRFYPGNISIPAE